MAVTYHTDIQKLYVAYFNRPADVDGLNFWESVVEQSKGDTAAVSAAFAATTEYQTTFANMSPSAVVTQIYKNLFGTTPDTAGLNFWATKLADGTISIDNVVKNISEGALGADKTTFNNKVAAAVAFTAALDTPAEITAYTNPKAAAPAKAFLSSINTDATLAAAIAPAALAATVQNVITAANVGSSSALTLDIDTITGTAGNDTFRARIFDNSNSLQSGDQIDGAGGAGDRLEADVGNSQDFAISPETVGVETIAIRGQAIGFDSKDNNLQSRPVQIDAERTVGVNQWESNNSRADVVIEDIRILNSQITKDITIAMVETDPGHVDFGVYFDQYSLRSQTNSTNTLRLQLMDTRSAAQGKAPLLESPYNGFAFFYNGVLTTVQDASIDNATTYEQLLTAIQQTVAKIPALANVTVSLGDTFTVNDTLGTPLTGREIKLVSTNGDTINAVNTDGVAGGAGWLAAGAVPPSSGLHTNMSTLASSSTELVTSKVILDDVGRGSTGGDLVIGGLSVGDTSESKGVQRFEIEVRDNSKLQTIASTNNTLREVTVVNGLTSSNSHAYVATVKDKGNLTVNGNVDVAGSTGINAPLDGSAEQHNSGFGFSDVRLIDGSAMTGKFAFTAEITEASIAKYLDFKDIAPEAVNDNINYVYNGGANDDTISVQIDGEVLGSNSFFMAGREDFTFVANGGAGNDNITVGIVNADNLGNTDAWYNNQVLNNNVTINGGDGDDTVWTPGAGNVNINLGTGNDTVYTDNTGTQAATAVSALASLNVPVTTAVWVLNTTDQATAGIVADRNLADLRSDTNETYNIYRGAVTVTYKGLTSTVTVPSNGFKTSDKHMNQAIKDAVNNNAVLNKLIVATDGPANTLVITSLIDGEQSAADLSIGLTLPTTLTPSDITGAAAAYGLPANSVLADVLTAMNTALTTFTTNGDYVDQLAQTGALGGDVEATGAASLTTSDNVVTGGLGNDVIVLGTTDDGATTLGSSNEIVVYGAGAFGNDTIVHFEEAGFGIDQLNFSALGGAGAQFGAGLATNKSITVALDTVLGTGADQAAQTALIQAAYVAAGDSATAVTHVYVAVDANNVGEVYTVTDAAGTAAGNIVVTLVGTIDLADTDWTALTAANFV